MKNLVFVADFFVEQGVTGGAEVCNDELIGLFLNSGYVVEKINSHILEPKHVQANKFYIIANFMNLSKASKKALSSVRYIIFEHDHKYVSTNDPSKFVNMLAPKSNIINRSFYENAEAVLCQSKIHAETLQKNLLINHVVNLGGNLWSDAKLDHLSSLIDTKKTRKNAVMYSNNKNKGMPQTVDFCKKNKIEFEFIKPSKWEEFVEEIAKTERLIFFPQWLESFNRVSVEARILGCKLFINKLIGATSEPWFKEKAGLELIEFLKEKRKEIFNVFVNLVEQKDVSFIDKIEIPKISIITSLYKGKKYIKHFMEEVTNQTVFNNCELIILDANSPDNEYEVIKPYCEKYSNIVYERLNTTPSVQSTMNLGLKKASGEFVTLWNIDDTRKNNALEILARNLSVDNNVHLVYADSYQTVKENETFTKNSANQMYEHSTFEFSKENMIKCLPGPMPMWKKEMTDKVGSFDETLKFAGDWDMWLRCVDQGYKFKKIHGTMGLYYFNPSGLSTSDLNKNDRFAEERLLFYKHKNVFGEKVFNHFRGYFK